jgi:hypothetical protein
LHYSLLPTVLASYSLFKIRGISVSEGKGKEVKEVNKTRGTEFRRLTVSPSSAKERGLSLESRQTVLSREVLNYGKFPKQTSCSESISVRVAYAIEQTSQQY